MATIAFTEGSAPGSSSSSSNSSSSLDEGRFPAGTMLANRYRVIGLLGRGGMGEVYRANDLKLGQPVALKFLPAATARNPRVLARFHSEVRIARQVSHPNVCRVYDIGELEGSPYISMEYVDGEDLDSLLHRIGRLPSDKAIEMVRSLCSGLTAAHDKGVLHRDLKPANVMIDARGQVLIMDFGLAGLAGQIEEGEIRSGTPAYMAPEQLAGKEVTVRSDIYSLGLVMYEMFTGKRAFEDRARKAPSKPSMLVPDLDPAVERLIQRCLAADPEQRPASARAVAQALPGSDRLAAAVAAGVMPSPDMVAAAGSRHGIPVRSALIYFALMLAGLVLGAVLSGKTSVIQKSPLESSTDALAQKAHDLIRTLGYSERPADSAFGFAYNSDFQRYAESHEPPAVFAAQKDQGQPPLILFWYRQSPQYLQAINGDAQVSTSDPPATVSGMATVNLDSQGRLIYFSAVPPQFEAASNSAAPAASVWNALFAGAGIDPSALTQADPQWLPLYSFDARAAWTFHYAHAPDVPMRIEAASWRGKPVYFQVIGPWTRPARMQPYQTTASEAAGQWLYLVVLFALFVIAALLARKHFGRGKGDARGASRLAGFVLCCSLLDWLCEAHHVPTTQEYRNFTWALSSALFLAMAYWVLYMALEPYVRRRWPQSLISWSRLLGGGWRDPLVGGHLLIGCALGVWFSIFFFVQNGFLEHYGSIPTLVRLSVLVDARHAVGVFAFFLHQSIGIALTMFFLFFLLRALLRRLWLAAVVFVVLFTASTLLQGSHPVISGTFTAMQGALAIYTLIRFGVIPMVVGIFVSSMLPEFPVSADFSTWYAGSNIFALGTVLALSAWSFHTALAGRRLFREGLLD